MNLTHVITLATLTVCAVLSGCAADTPFPPKVMEKVSPTFHFEAWRECAKVDPSSGCTHVVRGNTEEEVLKNAARNTQDSAGFGGHPRAQG